MKMITRKMLFGYLSVLLIFISSGHVHAQKSKGGNRGVTEASRLKVFEICNDRLAGCCREPSSYCHYSDCKTALINCHSLPYGDFLAMASRPYGGGVTRTQEWLYNRVYSLDCIRDGLHFTVNESDDDVAVETINCFTKDAYYSVAFMQAIANMDNLETITFYEGSYPWGDDTVPFRLHFAGTVSTEDQYYNLSDTEGACR